MALDTTRDKFAMAIAGPVTAKYMRPNITREELDDLAKVVWGMADAMVEAQQPQEYRNGGQRG